MYIHIKSLLILFILLLITLGCTKTRKDIEASLDEKMKDSQNPLMYMKTSKGDIVLELYPREAPETVANFIGLAEATKEFYDPKTRKKIKKHYFDGIIFHRIIPNFMIQGGDILGTGRGGPGYKFKDEISAKSLGLDKVKVKDMARVYGREVQNAVYKKLTKEVQNIRKISSQIRQLQKKDPKSRMLHTLKVKEKYYVNIYKKKFEAEKKIMEEQTVEELLTSIGYNFDNNLNTSKNEPYTLAMANSGPNTNGSQFFINLVSNIHLNGKHTVFGKVVKGRDVVQKIVQVKKDRSNKPIDPILIKKLYLLK